MNKKTNYVNVEGMTLRDYFAAKAMQGFCVREDDASLFSLSILAEHSYDLADAMLKEREIER